MRRWPGRSTWSRNRAATSSLATTRGIGFSASRRRSWAYPMASMFGFPKSWDRRKIVILCSCVTCVSAALSISLSSSVDAAKSEPLKFAPRDYFVKYCQRCHGVDGSNFPSGFATKESDEFLRASIDRMAKGPGGKDISAKELDAQLAYHRLFSDGKPF